GGGRLVEGGADRVDGRAVHLAFDDLRMDADPAVVDRGVVDDLYLAGLRVDLDHAGVDLGRVRQRQVAELPLLVGQLERRHVDVAAVGRDVAQLGRDGGDVRVDDRAAGHERQRGLRTVLAPRPGALH